MAINKTPPSLSGLVLLLLFLSAGQATAFDRCPGQAKDACLSPLERYHRELDRSGHPGVRRLPRQLYREQLDRREALPGLPGLAPFGESYRDKIQLSENRPRVTIVTRLNEVAPYIGQCLGPADEDGKPRSVTMRLLFRADGTLIAPPRITYGLPTPEDHAQEAFVNRVVDAISRCTPLPLGGGFEKAIAGRPYLIRFISGAKKELKI